MRHVQWMNFGECFGLHHPNGRTALESNKNTDFCFLPWLGLLAVFPFGTCSAFFNGLIKYLWVFSSRFYSVVISCHYLFAYIFIWCLMTCTAPLQSRVICAHVCGWLWRRSRSNLFGSPRPCRFFGPSSLSIRIMSKFNVTKCVEEKNPPDFLLVNERCRSLLLRRPRVDEEKKRRT